MSLLAAAARSSSCVTVDKGVNQQAHVVLCSILAARTIAFDHLMCKLAGMRATGIFLTLTLHTNDSWYQ
jgi:hypothetical protein